MLTTCLPLLEGEVHKEIVSSPVNRRCLDQCLRHSRWSVNGLREGAERKPDAPAFGWAVKGASGCPWGPDSVVRRLCFLLSCQYLEVSCLELASHHLEASAEWTWLGGSRDSGGLITGLSHRLFPRIRVELPASVTRRSLVPRGRAPWRS